MQPIQLTDALFRGAVSLEHGDGWAKPWRIPVAEYDLFPPGGIGGTAEIPAGVRLALVSDTRSLEVGLLPSGATTTLDCVINEELVSMAAAPPGTDRVPFSGLPAGNKRIEIYLSQTVPVRLTGLTVEDGARVVPVTDDRPRWITYGSSISQCTTAASPAQTWPALVARRNRLGLTCLGFGGNCHLEPMVARLIRDQPADLISLCLGINVQGGATLAPRTFRAAVIGFVKIVREGHPGAPIAVLSPILSPPRETARNAVGLSLVDMRGEIGEAVAALRACGDPDVHYVDGLAVFGEAELPHLPDLLHPNAEGYAHFAVNFQRAVVEPIFKGAR